MSYSALVQSAARTVPAVIECGHDWVNIFSAMLAPAIAAVAVLIAHQQWKVNRNRLRLDLFEKRYEVFVGVRALREDVLAQRDALNDSHLQVYDQATLQAVFLFGSPTTEYIAEVREMLVSLLGTYDLIKDNPRCEEAKAERRSIITWFRQQHDPIITAFAPMLRCTS